MTKTKKSSISILTIISMTLAMLVGCSNSATKDETTEMQETEAKTTKEQTSQMDTTTDKFPGGGRGQGGLVSEESVDTSSITNKYLDVEYGTTSNSQKMDIYLPENIDESQQVPVIIYVHGGAFKMGDKSAGCLKSVLEGVKKGYAVVSVNYRLSSEEIFPAGVEDIKAAIRYLRANASEYNLDIDNFAIWGESAGGNLASMIGTTGDDTTFDDASLGNTDQSSAVQAVVDWFGPLEFTKMDEQFETLGITPKMGTTSSANSPESAYIGADISQNEELAQKANPANYITENDPAFLIQHGTADSNVPITQSENFAKALASVIGSDNVTFETMEGAGHGDMGSVKAFETEENIERVFEFLDSQLK